MKTRSERRGGFSLMEMVIATAVLAGSGVALFALVEQASLFARRAEERTVALQLAQSTLDEFLAGGCAAEAETEGDFESDPRWNYRIEQSDVDTGAGIKPQLKRIVVSIYRSSENGGISSGTLNSPIVSLARWSRGVSPTATTLPEKASTDSSVSGIPESLPPTGSIPSASGTPWRGGHEDSS